MKDKPAKICVPVCVSRASDLPSAIKRAAEVADIIELRMDYLSESELEQGSKEICAAVVSRKQPMILTLRPAEYGGARPITAADRLSFRISHAWELRPDFWDLEVDLALILQQRQKEGNDVNEIVGQDVCPWNQTICSYHDFVGVPADLEKIYEQMAATPARILKIAVQADDATDCLSILGLLKRAQDEGREMIAIAMGPAGAMTRILGPSRGSFLTYGSVDDDSANAPGQINAKDLREVYRIDQIARHTKIFGIIGKPVAHSLSPRIQNAAFAAANLNSVYIPFEVSDVAQFIRRLAHPNTRELDWDLRGLSVTAPHKTTVMNGLDWIEPAARAIGAVNTIAIHENQMRGYNTDAPGFIAPLRRKFGELSELRCAIIGTGGASRAALWALRKEHAAATLFARDIKKAQRVATEFGVECRSLDDAEFGEFQLVVNTTPLGTKGELENDTPATAQQLGGVRLAYDLVYNPIETRFLREAKSAGAATLGGIEMLIAQAIEQFKLWTGSEPFAEVMRNVAFGAGDE